MFVIVCLQLLDLCILDARSLQFSYSVLATSALYHIFNSKEIALSVSGSKSNLCHSLWTLFFIRTEILDLCSYGLRFLCNQKVTMYLTGLIACLLTQCVVKAFPEMVTVTCIVAQCHRLTLSHLVICLINTVILV